MKREANRKVPESERLLAEARRLAGGEAVPPTAVIEAPDRELLRALRKATDVERGGVLRLLARVGARGRRVAEQALATGGFGDPALREILTFLSERQAGHPLVAAWAAARPAIDSGDAGAARRALGSLPPPLLSVWVRAEGAQALCPLAKGLEELLVAEPELADAILDALDRNTSPAVLEELGRLSARCGSRLLQKAIRSAFFRLEQIGVAVPTLPAGDAAREAAEPAPIGRAFLTAVDSAGDQAVWILDELPEGGFACLQAIIGEDGAIGEAHASVLVRRGYEGLVRDLEKDRQMVIAEVPAPIAIGALEEAYALNPTAASRDYVAWRQAQAAARRAERPRLPPVSEPDRGELTASSRALFETDACRHWHFSRRDAERAEEILAGSESALVLPEHETARRREEALARATRELLQTPWSRPRLVRRLEATALHFLLAGEERLARIARATAESLRREEVEMPPFLTAMLAKSLEILAETRERDKESKPVLEP